MKKRYRHFVPKRIPQTYEKTGNVSTTSLRDLHQAGVFPLDADERQNPAWGYEAEDSPVTVEKPFLSPASVEPASPSGAAALGHSERVGAEKAERGEKALCERKQSYIVNSNLQNSSALPGFHISFFIPCLLRTTVAGRHPMPTAPAHLVHQHSLAVCR